MAQKKLDPAKRSEILRLVAEGLTYQKIAVRLGVASGTIGNVVAAARAEAEDPELRAAQNEVTRLREEKAALERAERLASDTAPLKPGDLEGEDYSTEKRREYDEQMGEFGGHLRELGADPAKIATYISNLAESERRFLLRRLARSQALGAARETLLARQFEMIAQRVVWPVRADGYAARPRHEDPKRAAVLILSDLHVGARLPGWENPQAFDFTTAGRRLAYLALEAADFKPRYRDGTELVLGLNGDIIEGLLGWNDADNFPFAEQMVAATQFLVSMIEHLAAAFPRVRVPCQYGNHGRNKLKHEGRATSSKWDGFERVLYKQVEAQVCRRLPNVSFQIPRAPWTTVEVLGRQLLMIHGDTEPLVKSLSSSGGVKTCEATLADVRSSGRYGDRIEGLTFGHFHFAGNIPTSAGRIIPSGMLVPPGGHARAQGFGGTCGFWLFEATERHLVGDARFLDLSKEQDQDSSLDQVVRPFDPLEDDRETAGVDLPPLA